MSNKLATPLKPAHSPVYVHSERIPEPKFKLFDIAVLRWRNEEDVLYEEPVQILGVTWRSGDRGPVGWEYLVRNLEKPTGSPWLSIGHDEECMEPELTIFSM